MRYSISNTAEFGDYHTGPKIIDEKVKASMKEALAEIQSGAFAARFREDYENDFAWFKQRREADHDHPVEVVGRELRGMMPWLDPVEK